MSDIKIRIENLRNRMQENNIQAWLVPGTDPHMSEYLPDEWAERAYISGFTGSMGFIVITLNDAGLWTDSRYFLQAEKQLAGTGIRLFKKGIKGTPEPVKWLCDTLESGQAAGLNGLLFPAAEVERIRSVLEKKNLQLETSLDLLSEMRTERGAAKVNPVMLLSTDYSGEATAKKLDRVRKAYSGKWMAVYSALDQIAWLFNIRGNDVVYNPVVISYAIVSPEAAYLFVDPEKIEDSTKAKLSKSGVSVLPYENIFSFVKQQPTDVRFITEKAALNYAVYSAMADAHEIENEVSLVNHFKSIKNNTELSGFKKSMVNDGIAMTRFMIWFEKALAKGKTITEYDIGVQLKYFRSQQEGFMDESFNTIATFNENGGFVHYSPPAEGSARIEKDGVLLMDSGGQYLFGTTDITRTIATGKVDQQAKNDFTRVLQGHINLANAVFPVGTRGVQLDILARETMWRMGLDYGHGTCHGVGHFLNVHEGPQTIRKEGNDVVLEPGMVLTIEPGLYREGKWGLRVENMVYITEKMSTEFGSFLEFTTLTLFPIDLRMINMNLLDLKEIEWVNNYHKTVYNALSSHLEPDELTWLKEKTRQI
ncbi:aminopeptidase P family protein [Saccharicrinis sp. FJH54]|uniref:aminopeptidase P family protein n=1 Tax=Saccharicrinis sp. FJH54 TaxID=3344665 RepID=UPI0035D3EFE9